MRQKKTKEKNKILSAKTTPGRIKANSL